MNHRRAFGSAFLCALSFNFQHAQAKHTHAITQLHTATCPSQMSRDDCDYYVEGFNDGQEDHALGMYNLHANPDKVFDRPIAPAYRAGYDDGYKQYQKANRR